MPVSVEIQCDKGNACGDKINVLLSRWLSVAESQICALEVLCSQLPKMNDLLEENMVDLSECFSLLATHAQGQSKNVQDVLDATKLEIDGKLFTLKEAYEKFGNTDVILEAVSKQEKALQESVDVASVSSDKMLAAVSSAIVGMQFQDRVSQNLVIARDVSKEVVLYLKKSIDHTISDRKCINTDSPIEGITLLDKDFAKEIIQKLKLGELQYQFVEHLINHGYIESGDELGFDANANTNSSDNDDVELF